MIPQTCIIVLHQCIIQHLEVGQDYVWWSQKYLAPVFNNETMSETEYLEILGSFYGDGAADEVSKSIVKINLVSKDGSKQTLKYPLSQLLCGNL